MYLRIKTLLLAVSLIAALVLASETEGFAMGNIPSYFPWNQGGQQYGGQPPVIQPGPPPPHYGNYGGGGQGRHHSAPEPSTLILIGTGFVGLWAFRKKLM